MAILFFARDPGPANQLVAAHELLARGPGTEDTEGARNFFQLARRDLPAKIFAAGPAKEVWTRAGITASELQDTHTIPAQDRLSRLSEFLEKQSVHRVVTGAGDIDDDTERLLWLAARQQSIPSHAFIDHPANLAQRFRLHDGTAAFPDFVHVPLEAYTRELTAAGISRDIISVTGPLHLRRLKRVAAKDAKHREIRSKWSGDGQTTVILFASECASEMAASGRAAAYNEFDMLDSLTRMVVSGGPVGPVSISPERAIIVVRPHPRDLPGKYNQWLEASDHRTRRLVSADGTPEQAILASDIVVGMDSSLLRDARALQKPALSLTGANLEL